MVLCKDNTYRASDKILFFCKKPRITAGLRSLTFKQYVVESNNYKDSNSLGQNKYFYLNYKIKNPASLRGP